MAVKMNTGERDLLVEYITTLQRLRTLHNQVESANIISRFAKARVDNFLDAEEDERLRKQLEGKIERYELTSKLGGGLSPLVGWLAERGIQAKSAHKSGELFTALDGIAYNFWDKFDKFPDLFRMIRQAGIQGGFFILDFGDYNPQLTQEILRILRSMIRVGMFQEILPENELRQIRFVFRQYPVIRDFFSGVSYERYIRELFLRAFSLEKLKNFKILSSLQAEFPGNEDHEIDLLCWVDGFVVWIEVKTGEDIAKDMHKYMTMYSAMHPKKYWNTQGFEFMFSCKKARDSEKALFRKSLPIVIPNDDRIKYEVADFVRKIKTKIFNAKTGS